MIEKCWWWLISDIQFLLHLNLKIYGLTIWQKWKMSRPDKVHASITFIHSHLQPLITSWIPSEVYVIQPILCVTCMSLEHVCNCTEPFWNLSRVKITSIMISILSAKIGRKIGLWQHKWSIDIFSVLGPTYTERKDKTWWKYYKASWRARSQKRIGIIGGLQLVLMYLHRILSENSVSLEFSIIDFLKNQTMLDASRKENRFLNCVMLHPLYVCNSKFINRFNCHFSTKGFGETTTRGIIGLFSGMEKDFSKLLYCSFIFYNAPFVGYRNKI